jgi:hypothetical protein
MPDFYTDFTELTDEDKLSEMKSLRDAAWYANLEWLEEAQMCHKFKAGDQWSEDEKFKLQLQNREPLVWNYIHSAVELVSGTLAQNPVRIYPYPVERSDDFLCEVLEDLVIYVDENQCNAEIEETKAFESGVITGIGDVVIDVGPHPNNPNELEFTENALEAYEVLIDPMSKKADLSDARHIIYEKWITIEDFKVRYTKHIKDIEEIFTVVTDPNNDPSAETYDGGYTESPFEYYDEQNKRILVVHYEYRQAYKRYYVQVDGQEATEIEKEQALELKALGQVVIEIYDTKVNWVHYIHDRILWEGESPVYAKDFSLCRMQVYMDRSTRQSSAYGVVKLMIDPQKECNRRWMHANRLLGSQGVGVMAEADAFHDIKQAQDSWSDPDAITFMAKGGLNKVKEKTVPDFPNAPIQMESLNQEAMKRISGINPDLMGIAQQRREPGINLKLRQQQGLTMLSKIFNNYKAMRKEIYKRKLEVITRYMPDAQIRKILGETEKYTFQQGYIIDQKRGLVAPIRAVRDLGYNVRVEDAPGGVNKTMAELSVMLEMMQSGMPMDPNTIIDKLDLSPKEKWDWKAYIAEEQEQDQQAQQQDMELRAQDQQAKTQMEQMKLQITEMKIQLDNQTKVQISNAQIEQKDKDSRRDFVISAAELEKAEQDDAFNMLVDMARNGLNNPKKLLTETPSQTGANVTGQ